MHINAKLLIALISLAAVFSSCASDGEIYRNASAPLEKRVEDLLGRMTLEEKILQLNQYTIGRNTVENNIGEAVREIPAEIGSLIYFGDDAVLRNQMQKKAVEESRLGIPILFGHDVIHGYRTIFPIPLAQACSWNPEIVRRSCAVAAAESYSCGVDWTFSPMVDVARDPRWGRVMEGYGEDPYAASVYCRAAVEGYQGDDLAAENTIAACLKHYVGYGASEAGRDYVPTEISDQTLWDTYLPPFEAGVKAGAATIMSAFHNISGTPASGNHYILTEVLKEKWGHDGFVVSDWDAVRQLRNQGMAADDKEAAEIAFNAGIEMDMVDDLYKKYIPELLDEGKISMKQVDEAVRRVLRIKFRLGLFEHPFIDEKPDSERYLQPESLSLAELAAAETMVLLKNKGSVLPLDKNCDVALIGPFARTQAEHNGNWRGRAHTEDVVSIADGIRNEFTGRISVADGCQFDGDDRKGFGEAVRAARRSDVAVVCIGHKAGWSGENCSRSTIEIPQVQIDLLKAVKASGKPVVVLVSSGRPVDLREVVDNADAILQIWHPGTMAGPAVAGILDGRYNPSAKLAITFPYSTGQIPIYYNRRNSGRRGTQGLYKDIQSEPLYEFGHGLSYTTFEYGEIQLSSDKVGRNGKLTARVEVRNTGSRDGQEAVLWYICDPYSHITRPVKELKYFEKQNIPAGESRTFTFEIDPMRDLGFVDRTGRCYLDTGEYRIMAGGREVAIEVVD
ncbi:MAG: glycoside hydrolase family 3 N-terminal domain-containing protein [Candidatus Cryptobacteroides sp.]